MLSQLVGDGPKGTSPTFDTDHAINLGRHRIELHIAAAAHTPGDSFVWLPQGSTVFTGDITGSVQVDQSDSAYLDQFDAVACRNAQAV